MINDIRILRGTKAKWNLTANQNRIIPKGFLAVEYEINSSSILEGVKLKIGYGLPYASTPYIGSSDSALTLPTETVYIDSNNQIYVLNNLGNRTDINLLDGLNIQDILDLDENILTDNELAGLQNLISTDATLASLSSSQLDGNTSQVLNNNITLTFNVLNKTDLKELTGGRIEVSDGNWNNLVFDLKTKASHVITAVDPVTIINPKEVTFTLYATNKYGREYKLGETSSSFKAIVYYGYSANAFITNPSSLSGLVTLNVLSINEIGILAFNHSNQPFFDYIFIETVLESNDLDIRDNNLQGTPNSFDARKIANITFGGKLFSAYITNIKSSGNLKAIVK